MDLDIFNFVPMEAFGHLAEVLKRPISIAALEDRDRFYSWTLLGAERELGGKRLLLQYAEGGLAWIHVDQSDMMFDYSMIGDDEAREIWPRMILQTSPEVRSAVATRLQAGLPIEEALRDTFGRIEHERLLEFDDEPADDGSILKRYLIYRNGVLCVWVVGSGIVVRSELIDGDEAWKLVKPVIDPDD